MTTVAVSSPSFTTTYHISYDNLGRVSSVISSGTSTQTLTNTYTGNAVVRLVLDSGSSYPMKDSMIFNSRGRVITDYSMYDTAIQGISNYVYSNSGDLLEQIYADQNGAIQDSSVYTWQNGDIEFDGSALYQYSTNRNIRGSLLEANYVATKGLNFSSSGLNTVHLLQSVATGSGSLNLTYSYDAYGNISSIKLNGAGVTQYVNNTFVCQ